jgi:DNA-binding transcriptional ArsR family regulator
VNDDGSTVEGLRVLAHPLRLRLLSLLTARALSGSEAARELGESQANVSYHLRRLHRAGLVTAVDDPQQRGRTQRYQHDPVSGEQLGAGLAGDHVLLASTLAAELQRRSLEHLPGSPEAFTDAELWVRPETWTQVLAAVRQVGIDLHRQAVAPDCDDAIRVSATISLFQMEPPLTGCPADGIDG